MEGGNLGKKRFLPRIIRTTEKGNEGRGGLPGKEGV